MAKKSTPVIDLLDWAEKNRYKLSQTQRGHADSMWMYYNEYSFKQVSLPPLVKVEDADIKAAVEKYKANKEGK